MRHGHYVLHLSTADADAYLLTQVKTLIEQRFGGTAITVDHVGTARVFSDADVAEYEASLRRFWENDEQVKEAMDELRRCQIERAEDFDCFRQNKGLL